MIWIPVYTCQEFGFIVKTKTKRSFIFLKKKQKQTIG